MRGVSRQAINDLVVRGILALHDGRIDVAEADAACKVYLDPAKSQILNALTDLPGTESTPEPDTPTDTQDVSFHTARTMREKFNALTAEAGYLKLLGTLTGAADQARVSARRYRALRDKLQSIPDRTCDILAAERDAGVVHDLLVKEIDQALYELSDDARAEFAAGTAERMAG